MTELAAASAASLLSRSEAATMTIDAALSAWASQSLVDRRTVTDLLLDIRTLLNPTLED